jgi:hypothetical protein
MYDSWQSKKIGAVCSERGASLRGATNCPTEPGGSWRAAAAMNLVSTILIRLVTKFSMVMVLSRLISYELTIEKQ